jgi:hypothetical protein
VRDAVLPAVDLGLRTGFAAYGGGGRLTGYRSQNYGTRERLKRGADAELRDHPGLRWLVVEDASLARIWGRSATRLGAQQLTVAPEQWRPALLHPSEQRSGTDAKRTADRLARAVIRWSGAPRPTALRHDAAEAILIGLWGALEVGLLPALPQALRPQQR